MRFRGNKKKVKLSLVCSHPLENAHPAEPATTMIPIVPDIGHAVRPDGTLKEASEMSWSYDADESIPFPQGAPKGQTAVTVAGAHRSGRTHRPSQHVLEAVAASSSGSGEHSGAKRKAPSTSVVDRHVARKIIINMDDVDNDLSDPGDVNSTTTDPVEHAGDISSEADYQSIKAMADADHEVSFHPMAWSDETRNIDTLTQEKKVIGAPSVCKYFPFYFIILLR